MAFTVSVLNFFSQIFSKENHEYIFFLSGKQNDEHFLERECNGTTSEFWNPCKDFDWIVEA